MSDRLTVRLISRLARASARKRAYTPAETITQRHRRARPAATAMSVEERAAIRKAGADDARRSRARQGLPERIEDPAAVAVLAAIMRDSPARPAPSESTSE